MCISRTNAIELNSNVPHSTCTPQPTAESLMNSVAIGAAQE